MKKIEKFDGEEGTKAEVLFKLAVELDVNSEGDPNYSRGMRRCYYDFKGDKIDPEYCKGYQAGLAIINRAMNG